MRKVPECVGIFGVSHRHKLGHHVIWYRLTGDSLTVCTIENPKISEVAQNFFTSWLRRDFWKRRRNESGPLDTNFSYLETAWFKSCFAEFVDSRNRRHCSRSKWRSGIELHSAMFQWNDFFPLQETRVKLWVSCVTQTLAIVLLFSWACIFIRFTSPKISLPCTKAFVIKRFGSAISVHCFRKCVYLVLFILLLKTVK